MSEEAPKNITALLARLAVIPTIIGLRRATMDVANVTLIGAWVLWLLFDAVLTAKWKQPSVARITKNIWVRMAVVGAVSVTTGWFMHAVHKPALMDPEATENKYVRIKKVSPPDARFSHAVLIEFGVTKWNSEGIAIVVQFCGDKWDEWWGEPDRTDKQDYDGDVLICSSQYLI